MPDSTAHWVRQAQASEALHGIRSMAYKMSGLEDHRMAEVLTCTTFILILKSDWALAVYFAGESSNRTAPATSAVSVRISPEYQPLCCRSNACALYNAYRDLCTALKSGQIFNLIIVKIGFPCRACA